MARSDSSSSVTRESLLSAPVAYIWLCEGARPYGPSGELLSTPGSLPALRRAHLRYQDIYIPSHANTLDRHDDMKELRCMSFTSKGTSEILVAGEQDKMFVIDVNKGEVTKQVRPKRIPPPLPRPPPHLSCVALLVAIPADQDPELCRFLQTTTISSCGEADTSAPQLQAVPFTYWTLSLSRSSRFGMPTPQESTTWMPSMTS